MEFPILHNGDSLMGTEENEETEIQIDNDAYIFDYFDFSDDDGLDYDINYENPEWWGDGI